MNQQPKTYTKREYYETVWKNPYFNEIKKRMKIYGVVFISSLLVFLISSGFIFFLIQRNQTIAEQPKLLSNDEIEAIQQTANPIRVNTMRGEIKGNTSWNLKQRTLISADEFVEGIMAENEDHYIHVVSNGDSYNLIWQNKTDQTEFSVNFPAPISHLHIIGDIALFALNDNDSGSSEIITLDSFGNRFNVTFKFPQTNMIYDLISDGELIYYSTPVGIYQIDFAGNDREVVVNDKENQIKLIGLNNGYLWMQKPNQIERLNLNTEQIEIVQTRTGIFNTTNYVDDAQNVVTLAMDNGQVVIHKQGLNGGEERYNIGSQVVYAPYRTGFLYGTEQGDLIYQDSTQSQQVIHKAGRLIQSIYTFPNGTIRIVLENGNIEVVPMSEN